MAPVSSYTVRILPPDCSDLRISRAVEASRSSVRLRGKTATLTGARWGLSRNTVR